MLDGADEMIRDDFDCFQLTVARPGMAGAN
jgi:hypothetical protein